jgi:adenylosuccinate synthase
MGSLFSDLSQELALRAEMLRRMYGVEVDLKVEQENLERARQVLAGRITNTARLLHGALVEKRTLLIEGAQATLLDLDHGTYPYVTSSSTTVAGALQGLGLPPSALTSCIGVAKAYCTRVGEGSFPTEVTGPTGDRLRERGGEYGSTTGRPRRCGWVHLPDLQWAAHLNGFTHWNITKLDVLDEEETIPVGVGIGGDGAVTYEKLKGWKTPIQGITDFSSLPAPARAYVSFLEERTSIPASFIGTGPAREAMVLNE